MQRTASLLPMPQETPRRPSPHQVRPATRAALVMLTLAVGLALRGLLLNQPGLHPDEALYASWALRIADGSDPALLGVYVDKPPLLLYLLAGLFRLAGFDGSSPPQAAHLILIGRLAALLASAGSLALLWSIAHRVYGPTVALLALALFALSPLAVRLAPTLFTDPWLVLGMLLSLWAALTGRAFLAGLAFGLAFAAKQQALLLAPLLLAAFFAAPRPVEGRSAAGAARLAWRWLNGFALLAVAVLWWDSLRWQWMPSYWERSAQTYGGLALALDASLLQRLAQWGELLGYTLGWPLWLGLAALLAAAWRLRRGRHAQPPAASGWFDRLLLVFVAAWLLLHLLTNLAAWDRYALPLVPLLALLAARGAQWSWQIIGPSLRPVRGQRWIRAGAAVALAGALLATAQLAAWARLPLADGGAYDGVAQTAARVAAAGPAPTVLYHQALGWHYNFYLYNAPVDLRWWQEPADLARKASASMGQRQWIAFAAGREDEAGARAALARFGLELRPVLADGNSPAAASIVLYSIEPILAGAPSHVP